LYNYLNKIFKIFGFSNVILMDCAISDKDTKGQITVPGKPGSISQGARIDNFNLVKNKHKDDIHTIDVQVRSIDSIVKETGLKPNLIKIDVEGHELNVLKGMVYTLVNIRPKIIIECEERHIKGFSVHDVFNLLLEKDYIGYYFENAQKMPLNNFNLERDQTAHLRENHKPEIKYVANFNFEPS